MSLIAVRKRSLTIVQDAPGPDEILFALVMANGGRIHSRLGGLTKDQVSAHDGQR